ncbi:MAG: hypothetical protein A2848_00580 [Candidatus Magasanikbacteria bacterium RIFCSPHIGHO2_01_FULL_50_8]|uniref:Uncharacterized protein n=2 Tax=Candidatus Magasanikiibacteriota TaxID=1752731 RepID=A0A1F6LS61_9BACT|nr:MAG: hypothetical protein A2848_00580 [Candidatus Magasanikbacteria bacterium RIFCSPHIGHO2_01_FULL_50_8]OGH67940.1 MAG: hypothetical protein A3C15_00195 [Candidatus Magasanikbacteria bacterium RIFCSPHIGHO2_02_FULL_50_9b]
MKDGHTVREQRLKDELVDMIADVAVMATERHLEVVALFKGQGVEIATMRADIDQVKADVAQVRADVSSIKAKMTASEVAAEKRHDALLGAIRGLRGVPNAMFAL